MIVPGQLISGLLVFHLALENTQRNLLEQIAGDQIGLGDVCPGERQRRLLASTQGTGMNLGEWNFTPPSRNRQDLTVAPAVECDILLTL